MPDQGDQVTVREDSSDPHALPARAVVTARSASRATGADAGTTLALQWRTLNRVATFVACLTSPAVFFTLWRQHNVRIWLAAIITLAGVAAFRGLIDVAVRRVIPWPNLLGADDRLHQEDAVARRRAWYWASRYRLVVAAILVLTCVWVGRVLLYNRFGVVHVPGTTWHWIAQKLGGALSFSTALQVFVLLFANVAILIGPFLLMAIRQIKAYEPGDADWGVRLDHVRGQTEAKAEIERVINLWQSGSDFERAGGKRERGLLFLGAPGTGKTMLAKAIATSFNSPFITVPGSGFAGMFIGMDILAVQYLAWKARRLANKWGGQCIVFIDEIDAVGMRRASLGTSMVAPEGGPIETRVDRMLAGSDAIVENRAWRERIFTERAEARPQGATTSVLSGIAKRLNLLAIPGGMMGQSSGALNQLLVVMDGIDEPPAMRRFVTRTVNTAMDASYVLPRAVGKLRLRLPKPRTKANQIYFIGACNVSIEALDPALVRPGRMGRHIHFETPDLAARKDIFDFYLAKVSHEHALDTARGRDELARITPGYSPAMIEQICSMALTYAHHDGRGSFDRNDVVEAITTVESGFAMSTQYSDEEAFGIAIHEAGHAVTSHVYESNSESTRLSIRRRGDSLGHHLSRQKVERHTRYRSYFLGRLIVLVAGCAAEQIFFGENTDGVSNDMERATAIAVAMVSDIAMRPERLELGKEFVTRSEDERERRKVIKQLCDIGEVLLVQGGANLSSPVKRRYAAELLGSAYLTAWTLIMQNRSGVQKVAETLVERREMHGDEVVDLLDAANLKPATFDYFETSAWPEM
jgi:ATP-dependent Zn protease